MKKEFSYSFDQLDSFDELNDEQQKLLVAAQDVLELAYAPYSHFHVGAAVLLKNGTIVTGVNVENASYPVGICAERAALSSVMTQFPKVGIVAMAVSYVNASGESNSPAYPCGMCRQFMTEIEDYNSQPISLILGGKKGKIDILEKLKDLLPFCFEKEQLK
jgi:cytidine deaminase